MSYNVSMKNEPVLTFCLSDPSKFHCSACRNVGDEGAFTLELKVKDLVEAFKAHVQEYHTDGEDINN